MGFNVNLSGGEKKMNMEVIAKEEEMKLKKEELKIRKDEVQDERM